MNKILTLTCILGLTACSNPPKPKVVYNNMTDTTQTTTEQIPKDTTTIIAAELPIHFDSTNYLIHPIGQFKFESDRGGKFILSSYSSESSDVAIAYRSGYSISGNNLDNLKFQNINSNDFHALTNKQIKIQSFTFLRAIFDGTKNRILLYRITDTDTNKDKKLNSDDIEALYISDIDGNNFKKVSPDLQELMDWETLEIKSRIYFRTIEDIDKNGILDKNDKLHYFYIDFNDQQRKTVEYYPIDEK